MAANPRAGKPALPEDLVDLPHLVTAYYTVDHDPDNIDQQVAFGMKNTVLPLDMLFVRPDGRIANIAANAVPYSTTAIPSAGPVMLVIELNGGRAAALGIRPGDKVRAAQLPATH